MGKGRLAQTLVVLVTAAALSGLLTPAAGAQQPVQGSPAAVDGPSPDIASPSGLGLSIGRDGSGGLVYLKQAGGAAHVFVSPLVSGSFQAPVQVDAGLAGTSSQPVIAAGNAGLLLVAFINAGELYVVGRPSQTVGFGAPAGLAGGASNPTISMSNFGKAYLAFAAADRGGFDVRAAYYYNGAWALEGPPLNAAAADDAGTGSGRPDVTAAGDGVAVVAWGESGHVYARRVWGTTPSVVYEQADAPPSGCTEASADDPEVSSGGDSSFAPVVFRERVICGGHQQSRVLSNRLHASVFDGMTNADGLSGAPADGADDPHVAVGEYGQGWVTSERTLSDGVFAQTLYGNGSPGASNQLNGLPGTAAPDPVPATAGLYSTFIAWQQEPGSSAPSEIRVRYAPDGYTLGPEAVISSPAQGPVDAADGLAAAGDVWGEAAVAWLQGDPGATTLMVAQMYQPPGPFSATRALRYSVTSEPVFAWSHPHGWGPLKYSVTVDGALVTQTYSNAAAPATPLPDGPHTWQAFAANPAGQQSQTRPAGVFVDTVAPRLKLKLRGLPLAGSKLSASLSYIDLPPSGEPRSDASGVAKVLIRWGDGRTTQLKLGSRLATHAYSHTGRYLMTVLVSDKAGNVRRLVTKLKIVRTLPKAGHPKKPQRKPKTPSTGGASNPTPTAKKTNARTRAPSANAVTTAPSSAATAPPAATTTAR